ncbi:MAG: hypothetical protein C0403_10945 [Desulfobacterium sp.]|nr:hypothetical protein [Desulfobacterium sp.]
MHKKLLTAFVIVLFLTGCGSLKEIVTAGGTTLPPAPNLESLTETDSGPALSYNQDNPENPIVFQTEKFGVYLNKKDAAELFLYLEYVEQNAVTK